MSSGIKSSGAPGDALPITSGLDFGMKSPADAGTLPANDVWDAGTAPADRFQGINQELHAVQDDVFQKLNAKGNGSADDDTIQSVQDELEGLRNDLLGSMPQYPDPSGFADDLAGECGDFNSWQISYHAPTTGQSLVNYSGWSNFTGNWGYSGADDQMGKQVASLADQAKQIEDFATSCLRDARPFAQQKSGGFIGIDENSNNSKLQKMFNHADSGLQAVTDAAADVNQNGIAETSYTTCGYYVWDPVNRCWGGWDGNWGHSPWGGDPGWGHHPHPPIGGPGHGPGKPQPPGGGKPQPPGGGKPQPPGGGKPQPPGGGKPQPPGGGRPEPPGGGRPEPPGGGRPEPPGGGRPEPPGGGRPEPPGGGRPGGPPGGGRPRDEAEG